MRTKIKADASIRAIVGATFPAYRGRKFAIEGDGRPVSVTSYWGGGSRDYFAAIDMRSLKGGGRPRVMAVPQNGTPFDGGPVAPDGVVVPEGYAIVEHSIFCGKDVGITIHVNPADMPRYITA